MRGHADGSRCALTRPRTSVTLSRGRERGTIFFPIAIAAVWHAGQTSVTVLPSPGLVPRPPSPGAGRGLGERAPPAGSCALNRAEDFD
jgi:hypothetical protein